MNSRFYFFAPLVISPTVINARQIRLLVILCNVFRNSVSRRQWWYVIGLWTVSLKSLELNLWVCVSLNSLNFRAEGKLGREIPQSKLLKSVDFTSLSWLSAPLNHCQASRGVCRHFICESEDPCGCYAWFIRCIPGVQILILLLLGPSAHLQNYFILQVFPLVEASFSHGCIPVGKADDDVLITL